MCSRGSSRDLSQYGDDVDEDGYAYYPDEDSVGGFAHSVSRVRRDILESSIELEKCFGDEPPDERPTKRLLPLKELCCRFVGQNFPFGVVQLYPSRVPEDMQRRIAFWSFPADEKKLLDYVKVMGGATENDIKCARGTKVKSMIQSGETVS